MSSQPYTDADVDEILEAVLPCQSKGEYERTLARLAKVFQRHQPDHRGRLDGDPLNRLLWGRAIGRHPYRPSVLARTKRTGPLTWAEQHLLEYARRSDSNEPRALEPDNEYIALLLNRTVEEVEGHVGHGLPGLGLFEGRH